MRRTTGRLVVLAVLVVGALAASAAAKQTNGVLNPVGKANANKGAGAAGPSSLKSNLPASAASAKQQEQHSVQKQSGVVPGANQNPAAAKQKAELQQAGVGVPKPTASASASSGVKQQQQGSGKQVPPGGKKTDGPLPADRKAPVKAQAVAEFKIDVDGAASTDLSATVTFFRNRKQRSLAAVQAADKAAMGKPSSTAAAGPKTTGPASATATTTAKPAPAGVPNPGAAASDSKAPASPASKNPVATAGKARFAEVEVGAGLLNQATTLQIFRANNLSPADLVMLYEHFTATEKGHVDNDVNAAAAYNAAVQNNADWRDSRPQDMFFNNDLVNYRSDLVDVLKRHVWSSCLDAYLSAAPAHILRDLYAQNTGNCGAQNLDLNAFTFTLPNQNHVYTFGEEHGQGEITRFQGTVPAGGVANGGNLDDTLRAFARALGVGKHNGFENGGDFMSDQAGHILAKQFGGAACPANLVPQGIVLNAHPESSWKAAEDHVAYLIGNGCSAALDIRFHYPNSINYFVPLRPSHGTYTVTAGGANCQEPNHPVAYHFYNPKAQAV